MLGIVVIDKERRVGVVCHASERRGDTEIWSKGWGSLITKNKHGPTYQFFKKDKLTFALPKEFVSNDLKVESE